MTDVNQSIQNDKLVKAMEELHNNNCSQTQNKMIDEVMRARFVSPVLMENVPDTEGMQGKVTLGKDTNISFQLIENTEGGHFFLAFTDWDELRKWRKVDGQQTMLLTFDDLAVISTNAGKNAGGFVINPFGANIVFRQELIETLVHLKAERDEKIRIANLADATIDNMVEE